MAERSGSSTTFLISGWLKSSSLSLDSGDDDDELSSDIVLAVCRWRLLLLAVVLLTRQDGVCGKWMVRRVLHFSGRVSVKVKARNEALPLDSFQKRLHEMQLTLYMLNLTEP